MADFILGYASRRPMDERPDMLHPGRQTEIDTVRVLILTVARQTRNERAQKLKGWGIKMNILLAFAPFIVFVIIERAVGVLEGLAAGAIVSAGLVLRDWISPERRVKLMETGTFVLFSGLTLYAPMVDGESWTISEARLRVDTGLLFIILLTLALRRPFTLAYAREKEPEYVWKARSFARMKYAIAAAWALAFAVMAATDALLVYRPQLPQGIAIAVTLAALAGAMKFTAWYRDRMWATTSR